MTTKTYDEKIKDFSELLQTDQTQYCQNEGFTYAGIEENYKVTIKPGKKYVKIDVGSSGKYMVDAEGKIFGIKAYGVIHRGHQYGTLDTIQNWDWKDYVASSK